MGQVRHSENPRFRHCNSSIQIYIKFNAYRIFSNDYYFDIELRLGNYNVFNKTN